MHPHESSLLVKGKRQSSAHGITSEKLERRAKYAWRRVYGQSAKDTQFWGIFIQLIQLVGRSRFLSLFYCNFGDAKYKWPFQIFLQIMLGAFHFVEKFWLKFPGISNDEWNNSFPEFPEKRTTSGHISKFSDISYREFCAPFHFPPGYFRILYTNEIFRIRKSVISPYVRLVKTGFFNTSRVCRGCVRLWRLF